MMKSFRTTLGFTLIELVITIAIIAVLASAAAPVAELSITRAREQELRIALRQIREAIDAYRGAWEEGHVQRRITASGYPKSLEELVNGVPDEKHPKKAMMYFLRRIPRDPMDADSAVPAPQTWGKRAYASPPSDPQEGVDVFDVYSLAPGVGLNGIPYRQW